MKNEKLNNLSVDRSTQTRFKVTSLKTGWVKEYATEEEAAQEFERIQKELPDVRFSLSKETPLEEFGNTLIAVTPEVK